MSISGTPRDGEGVTPSEHGRRHSETFHRTYRGEGEHFEVHHEREDVINRDTAGIIAGGSIFEVICGVGAATLGILGLVGILPSLFVTIGIITVGAGLMLAGGSIGAKYEEVLNSSSAETSTAGVAEASSGVTAETVGGAAGAALGILALLGVEAATLIPIALIVLGGAMAFGAGATRRLSQLMVAASGAPRYKQRAANESVRGAAFMQTIAGVGATVLGILTLVGVTTDVAINLVAVIVLGGGLLLSGMAVGGKLISMLFKDDSKDKDAHRPVYREYRSSSDAHPV